MTRPQRLFVLGLLLAGLFTHRGMEYLLVEERPPEELTVRMSAAAKFLLVSEPVPINFASASALQSVPGIGPVLAQRIVTSRAEHGMFSSDKDLLRVTGIGSNTSERIAPFLSWQTRSYTRVRRADQDAPRQDLRP